MRALLVAIDAYPDPFLTLDSSVAAAADVVDHLHATLGVGYERIMPLFDMRATRRAIVRALAQLTEASEPGDELLFYYRGHTACLPPTSESPAPTEVICPVDFNGTRRTAISVEMLREVTETLPVERTMTVILDVHGASRSAVANSRFNARMRR